MFRVRNVLLIARERKGRKPPQAAVPDRIGCNGCFQPNSGQRSPQPLTHKKLPETNIGL